MRAFAAHGAEESHLAFREQHHGVTADPPGRGQPFRDAGGGEVGAAAAEVRSADLFDRLRHRGRPRKRITPPASSLEIRAVAALRQERAEIARESSRTERPISREPRRAALVAATEHGGMPRQREECVPHLLLEEVAAIVEHHDHLQPLGELAQPSGL